MSRRKAVVRGLEHPNQLAILGWSRSSARRWRREMAHAVVRSQRVIVSIASCPRGIYAILWGRTMGGTAEGNKLHFVTRSN